MSSSKILSVYFEESVVGKIYLDNEDQFCFEYAAQWLSKVQAFPLSHSLPLANITYMDDAQIFFANLLPEGKVRKFLSSRLGLSEENDYSLLKALGEDCAGAFKIIPPSESPKLGSPGYEEISLKKIAKIFKEQPIFYLGIEDQDIRLSLAGAQDKIAVYYADNKIYLPKNGAPSSHILKFPSKDYAGLTENEYIISQVAQDCGLRMMQSQLLHERDFTGLLIERYDRQMDSKGNLFRLHQEDFCQALSISHQKKYQEEGGPSFTEAFELLEKESSFVLEDLEQLLRWLFFNVCVGNCDHHGKNLALLMRSPNQWVLSPFYDLLCTRVYPSLTKKQAMSIGGSFDGANLSAKHWQSLTQEVKFSHSRFMKDIALPVADTIRLALGEQLLEFKGSKSQDFLKQIADEVIKLTMRAERSLVS
jgi:serine/threonine-protein kinase HipA